VQKIWDEHVVTQLENHPAVFFIDLMLIHEVTSAQAFQMLEELGLTRSKAIQGIQCFRTTVSHGGEQQHGLPLR
jgi:homoaconitase/3-isopropylmalate dehydratase large subunit